MLEKMKVTVSKFAEEYIIEKILAGICRSSRGQWLLCWATNEEIWQVTSGPSLFQPSLLHRVIAMIKVVVVFPCISPTQWVGGRNKPLYP